jgi:hypothetical protein
VSLGSTVAASTQSATASNFAVTVTGTQVCPRWRGTHRLPAGCVEVRS